MHSVSHPVRRLATILISLGLAAIVATGTVLAGTPVTAGWRDHGYAGGAFRPASDKPESKLWYTDEGGGNVQWWGGMFRFSTSPPLSEFRIYKLSSDKSTWSPTTTIIDRRDNTHGDYLWDEATNTLYVASVAMPNTTSPFAVPATPDDVRIFRYTYDSGTDTYTQIGGSLWYRAILGTGSTASPAFRGGAWSVTIDKDSTGRLWVVLAQAHEVRYSTSDDNGQTWTTAAQLPTQGSNTINVGAMSDSDIASVIAFGNGSKNTVGVMWSDQDNLPAATNNGYYFSTIAAGDDPTVGANWSTDKLPNGGLGNIYADNHINMKATSDGTLYMVGKANTDTVNCATLKTRLLTPLYRRTAGGVWDAPRLVGTAGDCETRPQLAISEELNTIYVFLTAPNGGGVDLSQVGAAQRAERLRFPRPSRRDRQARRHVHQEHERDADRRRVDDEAGSHISERHRRHRQQPAQSRGHEPQVLPPQLHGPAGVRLHGADGQRLDQRRRGHDQQPERRRVGARE